MRSIVRHPLAWAAVAGAAALALVMTFAYLGAFLDPVGNARGLPVAVVSEDVGAAIGERRVNLGRQVVAALTSPRSPTGAAVDWRPLASREAALAAIRNDEVHAAVVLPRDYSRRLGALATPPRGPVAPARVEVLANPGAGSYARTATQELATAAVTALSTRLAATLAGAAGPSAGTPAQVAHRVEDAVDVRVREAQPIGDKSARGLSPFYFALMLALAGFLGTVIVNLGVEFLAGLQALDLLALRLHRRELGLSRTALWRAKLTLALALAVLSGVLQTVLAVAVLGMDATNPVALGLFAVLGVAAVATVTLAFLVPFGVAGSLFGVLFVTIFGVPSSGGPYPQELLPDFFRFLADWLPLRYLTDGARSLVFFDGSLDAGLGRALVVLAAYLAGGALAGGAFALAIDRRLARAPLHGTGGSSARTRPLETQRESGVPAGALEERADVDDEHGGDAPVAILFDVDGCLISSGGAGTRSWRRAFETLHGVPADIGELTEPGMTDPEVGSTAFTRAIGREPTDRELARLLGAYLEGLEEEVRRSPGYRVMPGVDALLPRLVEAGILLGIASGGLEGAAHAKLARGRLNRFFCFGGYGSDSRDRGTLTRVAIERAGRIHGHPLDASRVLVVGDTPRDVEAAHAAGAVAVGVATGKYSVEQLRSAGADHALPTLESPFPGVPDPPREGVTA